MRRAYTVLAVGGSLLSRIEGYKNNGEKPSIIYLGNVSAICSITPCKSRLKP
jgi:hypothetical protein